MQLSTSTFPSRKLADALVLPFWQGKKKAEPASIGGDFAELPIALGDFSGKNEEVALIYGEKEKRVLLVGLGPKKEVTVEALRRAYAAAAKVAQGKNCTSLNVVFPEKTMKPNEVARGVMEGILLANYTFESLKKKNKDSAAKLLTKLNLITGSKSALSVAKESVKLCEGVNLARDLVNGNADDVTPQHLGAVARGIARKFKKVTTTVFNKKRIQKEKMGLLLAVNQGSHKEPAFIIAHYKGDPKSKEHTVVVGKGVTYDTGGLNLKPTGSIETMKCDMGGAACALGTLQAAAALDLKVNLTAVVPATENAIDSHAYKPGDVYTGYNGMSVEIGNTDAEGRLVLADALAYTVKKLSPTRIVDFATLTGAMVICLGGEAIGLMASDDKLADQLLAAGGDTFERTWRLPLYDEYKEQLKSDIADISNTGGRPAGSITAALFLQEFVGDTPWAHCDIAGTAYLDKPRRYHPKNATGIGVRLMISFLKSHE